MKHFVKAILRAGNFTAKKGNTVVIDEAMLDELAANYDSQSHSAPAVIGHPKENHPAYGHAESLFVKNKILYAKILPTVAEFSGWVKKGLYDKVSVSLHAKDSPNNPKPGERYLRHIGFLGAQAPAIPGLPSAEFTANDGGMEITQEEINLEKEIKLTEEVDDMSEAAAAKAAQDKIELDKREADLVKREAGIKRTEDEFAAQSAKDRATEIDAKVKSWADEGKLPPAQAARALDTPARAGVYLYLYVSDKGLVISFALLSFKFFWFVVITSLF